MRKFVTEFCDNSTVHGVRYFTERRRHWSERIWWLIAFGLSLWLCSSSIRTIWVHWMENPITITFTDREIPISAIPFPTVTVCPQVKVSKENLDNDPSSGHNSDQVYIHLCSILYQGNSREKVRNDSLYDFMKKFAPWMNHTIPGLTFNGERFDEASDLFANVFTDDGYCHAFNTLNSHEMYTEDVIQNLKTVKGNPNISHWSLDDGYAEGVSDKEYPIRMFSSKSSRALSIHLRLHVEDDTFENKCLQTHGYRIILTVPGEAIRMTHFPISIPKDEHVTIRIEPKLITTSDGLKSYTPNQRQCFFNSERHLRYYKIYTQISCEAECLANFTKFKCGCVKFSMPRDKSIKMCGAGSIHCSQEAESKLFGEDIVDAMQDSVAKIFRENCNCLPACTTIAYDIDIDKNEALFVNDGPNKQDIDAEVDVLFRESKTMALQRSALYTFTDFLAICGGLLGLFLGVSLLSIVEFIYFFTLRLFWSIFRSKSENEAANDNISVEGLNQKIGKDSSVRSVL